MNLKKIGNTQKTDTLMITQKICIVTCHGFTGYPEEMEPIGKFFCNKGYDWKNLQLPGHGTSPEDLKTKNWTDWTDYVLQEIDKNLKEYNNNVIMVGLSLGGALTLYTLINRPLIKAGICLATPINIMTFFQKMLLKIPIGMWVKNSSTKADIFDQEMKKNHKSYSKFHSSNGKEVNYLLNYLKKNLSKITQPILIIQSKKDQVVNYQNAQLIYDSISSKIKEIYFVEKSSHVLTKDYDRESIFSKSFEFAESLGK